jgi:hypothetical protein
MIPEENTFQVLVHGTPEGFIINGTETSSKELARTMLQNGYKKGMPVRLISCNTGVFGDGAGYQLSRYLKAPVMAPTKPISILGDGSYIIADEFGQFGRFRTFYNGK